MIRIKKYKNEWIVYESRDFERFHTHVRQLRVAKKIKKSVTERVVPETECKEVLISCLRLTIDKDYIQKLENRIKELENN